MEQKPKGAFARFLTAAYDVLFVMIICFATLFATMFVRKWDVVHTFFDGDSRYSVNVITLSLVVLGVVAYLVYLIRHSNKELQNMIKKLYDTAEEKQEGEKP